MDTLLDTLSEGRHSFLVLKAVLANIELLSTLTPEEYYAAVEAGTIDAQTAAMVDNAVRTEMGKDETIGLIEQSIRHQMESEEIQGQIGAGDRSPDPGFDQ